MCRRTKRIADLWVYRKKGRTQQKQLINSTPTSKCGRGDQKQILAILSSYHATVIVRCPQRACKRRRN